MMFTNTTPVDAYRGAGRPETGYLIERLVSRAATELGVDPVELRRKNFVRLQGHAVHERRGLRSTTAANFARVLDKALAAADWAVSLRVRPRRRSAASSPAAALGYYVEVTGSASAERDGRA